MIQEAKPDHSSEDESSRAARAAWPHHIGRLTQNEVASRLGVPNGKAHRLIARAGREGMVRVFVDGAIARCLRFERRLCRTTGSSFCEIAPEVGDEPLPLRSLGALGARYLRFACERGQNPMIGLDYGPTLTACVAQLPRIDVKRVSFVSLLGGFTRRFAANPFDVIHRIAERTGAEAYVLPVPFCLDSAGDLALLMEQRGLDEVFALARSTTLRCAGIGIVDRRAASLATSGMIEPQEYDEVARAGGRGEILGHFFDRRGDRVETELSRRLASLECRQARGGRGRNRQARGRSTPCCRAASYTASSPTRGRRRNSSDRDSTLSARASPASKAMRIIRRHCEGSEAPSSSCATRWVASSLHSAQGRPVRLKPKADRSERSEAGDALRRKQMFHITRAPGAQDSTRGSDAPAERSTAAPREKEIAL